MADNPPRVRKLLEAEHERYADLRQKFKDRYGHDPVFYARSPGRVNLIGEHIDYCGYAVLPMAVEQDIVLAVSNNAENIILANTDPAFEEMSCKAADVTIDKSDRRWHNYALCGIKGVMEHAGQTSAKGFNALVVGRIPKSAGLSSSSALVCCAALAMAHVNGWKFTMRELSELTAKCERYIGTEGGGMDQAISLMAQHGMAKLIEFNPLRTTDVHLPSGAAFVVSNSLAEHNKAATSDFNTRVIECRIAMQIIAKSKGLPWRQIRRLGDLQIELGASLQNMQKMVLEELHTKPYHKDEVCKILEVTTEELAETSLSENTLEVCEFKLQDRARHVYSEASRVLQFKEMCDNPPLDALKQLGRLMDESHASCRDLYQCSHPEVDTLVQACK
ncbi:hypothetical protein V1264_002198 [Littorina saxatilis]